MNKLAILIAFLFALSLSPDADAKIKRSAKAKRDFMKENPCPSTGETGGTCPGYIIDHIIPLKRGGDDHPGNMQWQTIEESKEKDTWE